MRGVQIRNASDVELFSSPDPAVAPLSDSGVICAALPALRHAADPGDNAAARAALATACVGEVGSPAPPATRPRDMFGAYSHDAALAVALVGQDVAAPGRAFVLPEDVLAAGVALVAESDPLSAAASDFPPQTGVAASHRDEGWDALVAHSVLITRRELRTRNEVAASSAGPEFDAAKEAELLTWMVHGAYRKVPVTGQRVLSMRWV